MSPKHRFLAEQLEEALKLLSVGTEEAKAVKTFFNNVKTTSLSPRNNKYRQ